MSPNVERFGDRLHDAEEGLKREVKEQQRRWQHRIHRGRVWFDDGLRTTHRRLRQSIPSYIRHGNLLSLLTAPLIYSLLLPFLLLDLWVTLYQSRRGLSPLRHALRRGPSRRDRTHASHRRHRP